MLNRILSTIDEGLMVVDPDLRLVYLNDTASRLVGRARTEAVGQPVDDVLPASALAVLRPYLTEAIATGRRTMCDIWFDDGARGFEYRLYPSADGVTVLFVDVTEQRRCADELRRREEHALRESRDVLALAMRAGRMGAWSRNFATDVVWWSRELEEIFGLQPGAFAGREADFFAFIHPDDLPHVQAAVGDAVRTRSDYVVEFRFRDMQGRLRWMDGRGRAAYGDDGTPKWLYGLGIDITERKEAEAALAAARERDRLLVHLDDTARSLAKPSDALATAARLLGVHLDANRCGFVTIDADGTWLVAGGYAAGTTPIADRGTVKTVGDAFMRVLRAGQPIVVSDVRADARLSPEERVRYDAAAVRGLVVAPVLESGQLEGGLVVATSVPRTWQPHDVALVQQVASRCWQFARRAHEDEFRAASLARERLARLEAEEQSRRLAQLSDDAEAANRAKDEFLAMLGHELRNPLAPILTALQLMRLRGGQESERERVVIERQVKHLTRLVDDLLDVSRIARGKVELKLAPVESADVIARGIEMASPLLESRSHTLTVDVPRTGLPMLVDAARISQVVSNLLTNAARYTPPCGAITVTATRDADEVRVSVRDTGIGIAPEVLAQVFDLFVRGRQGTTRAEGGLGLGLAIVRNLVERHGGRVKADSEGIGRGSVFTVWVPLAPILTQREPPQVARPAPPRPAARATRGLRVLIVDDNADAADMLAQVLSARGHETRVAHDGVEALRACANFTPQAAFLDLGLPVMDGYELASRLRDMPGLGDIRLIAVTGYGQDSDRRRTSAAGFHHHLVKPVDIAAVDALLP